LREIDEEIFAAKPIGAWLQSATDKRAEIRKLLSKAEAWVEQTVRALEEAGTNHSKSMYEKDFLKNQLKEADCIVEKFNRENSAGMQVDEVSDGYGGAVPCASTIETLQRQVAALSSQNEELENKVSRQVGWRATESSDGLSTPIPRKRLSASPAAGSEVIEDSPPSGAYRSIYKSMLEPGLAKTVKPLSVQAEEGAVASTTGAVYGMANKTVSCQHDGPYGGQRPARSDLTAEHNVLFGQGAAGQGLAQ
jgi:hypothetical protein